MTIRKSTPVHSLPARTVPIGAYVVTNSGDYVEMTPTLRGKLGNHTVRCVGVAV